MSGAILSTGKTNYTTPEWILDPVKAFFAAVKQQYGQLLSIRPAIDLDPCSAPGALVNASLNILPDPKLLVPADVLEKIKHGFELDDIYEDGILDGAWIRNELAAIRPDMKPEIRETWIEPCRWSIIGAEKQIQEALRAADLQLNIWSVGDGLQVPKDGLCTFENPPFGRNKVAGTDIQDWIWDALKYSDVGVPEHESGGGTHIILCIPETPEVDAWKNGIFLRAQGLCHLKKRVCFADMKTSIPKAIALVYIGEFPLLFKKFFQDLGRVENPSLVFADQAQIRL